MHDQPRALLFDSARVGSILEATRFDGLLAATPPNVLYLTGYRKPGGAAVLLGDALSRPALLVPAADLDFVLEDLCEGVVVRPHGSFVRFFPGPEQPGSREERLRVLHESAASDLDRMGAIERWLKDNSPHRARIATDSGPSLERSLKLPADIELCHAPELFKRLRSVKTGIELERLGRAAAVTEDAIGDTVGQIAHGVSQRTLARAFRMSVVRSDAKVRLDNISLDGGSAFGNLNLPEYRVARGSTIRFDVGTVVDGYASDVSRCFAYERRPERAAELHGALVHGQGAALALVRPGATASELFRAAVGAVRSEGIPHYDRTNVGHGIGIDGDGYDPPLLAPGDDLRLEEGMTLCVETPYYEIGFAGLQVEDMVVVTKDGYTPLTTSPRALQIIP